MAKKKTTNNNTKGGKQMTGSMGVFGQILKMKNGDIVLDTLMDLDAFFNANINFGNDVDMRTVSTIVSTIENHVNGAVMDEQESEAILNIVKEFVKNEGTKVTSQDKIIERVMTKLHDEVSAFTDGLINKTFTDTVEFIKTTIVDDKTSTSDIVAASLATMIYFSVLETGRRVESSIAASKSQAEKQPDKKQEAKKENSDKVDTEVVDDAEDEQQFDEAEMKSKFVSATTEYIDKIAAAVGKQISDEEKAMFLDSILSNLGIDEDSDDDDVIDVEPKVEPKKQQSTSTGAKGGRRNFSSFRTMNQGGNASSSKKPKYGKHYPVTIRNRVDPILVDEVYDEMIPWIENRMEAITHGEIDYDETLMFGHAKRNIQRIIRELDPKKFEIIEDCPQAASSFIFEDVIRNTIHDTLDDYSCCHQDKRNLVCEAKRFLEKIIV